jgi:hypothetical protein
MTRQHPVPAARRFLGAVGRPASGTPSCPPTLDGSPRLRAPPRGARRSLSASGPVEAAEGRGGALARRQPPGRYHSRAAPRRVRAAAARKRAPRPSSEGVAVEAVAAPPDNRAVSARRANSLVIEPPRGAHHASPGGGTRHEGQRPGAGGTCVGAARCASVPPQSPAHRGGRRRALLHTLGGSPELMGLGAVAVSVQIGRSTARACKKLSRFNWGESRARAIVAHARASTSWT